MSTVEVLTTGNWPVGDAIDRPDSFNCYGMCASVPRENRRRR